MRRSSRSRWLSGIGAVVLIGGLALANYGSGVPPAEAKPGDGTGTDTQNWDTNISSAKRFTVLAAFGGAAVRDHNTGLVWEQAPDATVAIWGLATGYCVNKTVGGTRGWRLPSVVELASLIDPSLPAPYVPASVFIIGNFAGGHPGVLPAPYWSATSQFYDPAFA